MPATDKLNPLLERLAEAADLDESQAATVACVLCDLLDRFVNLEEVDSEDPGYIDSVVTAVINEGCLKDENAE